MINIKELSPASEEDVRGLVGAFEARLIEGAELAYNLVGKTFENVTCGVFKDSKNKLLRGFVFGDTLISVGFFTAYTNEKGSEVGGVVPTCDTTLDFLEFSKKFNKKPAKERKMTLRGGRVVAISRKGNSYATYKFYFEVSE